MIDRLNGLRLTKTERLLLIGLSSLYVAPRIWSLLKQLSQNFAGIARDARNQLEQEDETIRRGRRNAR
jgi:hypothetical protein